MQNARWDRVCTLRVDLLLKLLHWFYRYGVYTANVVNPIELKRRFQGKDENADFDFEKIQNFSYSMLYQYLSL